MNHLQVWYAVQERLIDIALIDSNEDTEEEIEPTECKTYTELLRLWSLEEPGKPRVFLSEDLERVAATMLAIILSSTTTGPQIGLRVIGRPSAGKTMLAEAMSQCKRFVYATDRFTGIVSGHHDITGPDQIAVRMNGKCVMIKEADTMMELSNLSAVQSEIRTAMTDNIVRMDYRNRPNQEAIRCAYTMIWCGTQKIKQSDDTLLGSRFLDIYLGATKESRERTLHTAINSAFTELQETFSGRGINTLNALLIKMASPTNGFLSYKKDQIESGEIKAVPLTEPQTARLIAIGEFIAKARTRVERRRNDELVMRPESEEPHRIVADLLQRIAFYLAVVFARGTEAKVTQKIFSILGKIARDTASGFPCEIIMLLSQRDHTTVGLSSDQIAIVIGLSNPQTWSILKDLVELGIVTTEAHQTPQDSGRHAHYYFLTDSMKDIIKKAFTK